MNIAFQIGITSSILAVIFWILGELFVNTNLLKRIRWWEAAIFFMFILCTGIAAISIIIGIWL